MTSPYRVTTFGTAGRTVANLKYAMRQMQKTQDQMSSGKIITRPSDDPPGAVRSMQYRSDIKRSQQYSRNSNDALGWLGTADKTMVSSLQEIQRVRTLVLQGVNATADSQSRAALAAEIKNIRDGLIGLANTTYNNRPIFAGTADPEGQVPPVQTYDSAGNYNGNTAVVLRTVGANASVPVAVDGPSVFGTPGPNDLWHVLDDIQTRLTSGIPSDIEQLRSDATGISDLTRLDNARLNIQNRLSEIGARYHRVETMQSRADDSVLTMQGGLAQVESTDLAQAAVAFQLQSSAYQAALAATAKVIQPSLVDFLR